MAANMLWAHLLRKDATTRTTADMPSPIPPIAPQDKTGTSMRMLIHDTHITLEKFSARLDGLLQRVDDCRSEVVNANKLLDVERDKVLTEVLALANKCQAEMKAHIGAPAQAAALDLVRVSQVSTEKSVQALEKRIDALQTLLQVHTNVIQSIQDQQNTLIGAILPLVPVLHSISPQIDQIKGALSDMVSGAVSTMTNNIENVRSTLVAEFAHGHGCARSSTRVGSSHKSASSLRRKRSIASELGPQQIGVPLSSPLDNRGHDRSHLGSKRARVEEVIHDQDCVPLPRKLTRLAVSPTIPVDRALLLRTPQTPRQPLTDLPIPLERGPRVQHHMGSHTKSTLHEYMRPLETRRVAGGLSVTRSPNLWPPFRPLEPPTQDVTVARRRSAAPHDPSTAPSKPSTMLQSGNYDALSKAIKTEELLEANFSGVISIHSSPLSSPPPSAPQVTRHSNTNMARQDVRQDRPDALRVEFAQLTEPLSEPSIASPPKSMSLRDRRAQISRIGRTETRRFIPMVPWSDEEE